MNGIKRKTSKKTKVIWALLLIGFCAMEFPGVLFFGEKATPFIFGLPFIHGYILCWWVYMCCVFFYAYRCDWGRKSVEDTFTKVNDD